MLATREFEASNGGRATTCSAVSDFDKNVELEFRTNLVSTMFNRISIAYLFELDFDAALDGGSIPGTAGSPVARGCSSADRRYFASKRVAHAKGHSLAGAEGRAGGVEHATQGGRVECVLHLCGGEHCAVVSHAQGRVRHVTTGRSLNILLVLKPFCSLSICRGGVNGAIKL